MLDRCGLNAKTTELCNPVRERKFVSYWNCSAVVSERFEGLCGIEVGL